MSSTVAIERLPEHCTVDFPFNGDTIRVTSAPDGEFMDISGILRDPADYHAKPDEVHDLVDFGPAFKELIGYHPNPNGLFSSRDKLPELGIHVLADHSVPAWKHVRAIDRMAQRVIEDRRLYDDLPFCRDYFDLAREGFSMVRRARLAEDSELEASGLGVFLTLERGGLVSTRLAGELEIMDEATQTLTPVPGEIRVVTKRAHHLHGGDHDLMVSVMYRDREDLARMGNVAITISDFVNPASGASALAAEVSARYHGFTPSEVVHESVVSTTQGMEFTQRVLGHTSMGGVRASFWTLGTSSTLDGSYYLENPAVADAGHLLRHFIPIELRG